MHFASSERKLWRRWIKTGNPVVKSDTRVHHEAFWSQHAATRATCSDADRNTIDEHQWISSSGTDGSRRNTPTLDPTVQTDRNRTLHEHHVSTNTSSRPGRQRTTHVHAGGSHGHGSLNYFTVWNVQGLKPRTVPTKVPFVQDLLKDHKQLLIPLTETWLRERNDAELQVDGYTHCFAKIDNDSIVREDETVEVSQSTSGMIWQPMWNL